MLRLYRHSKNIERALVKATNLRSKCFPHHKRWAGKNCAAQNSDLSPISVRRAVLQDGAIEIVRKPFSTEACAALLRPHIVPLREDKHSCVGEFL
jgi:hypothetical protein